MKKYIKSIVLMLMSVSLFTACSDDNGSNPELVKPTKFVLNTPAMADQNFDLANSTAVVLTCSQPDYGFPAQVNYTAYLASKADMSDAVALSTSSSTCKLQLDAAEIAAALTTMKTDEGAQEEDFPMTTQAYFQVEAVMMATTGSEIESSRIKSNVVSLNKVELEYSLPPVLAPEEIFLVGEFCGWNWDNCVSMVPVYGTDDLFWHMVYIGEQGLKFNTAKAWDGGEKGFADITINEASELGAEIIDGGGNIASSNPGWYMMVVKATVEGRNIKYDVTFNKPEVRFIGWLIGGDWSEGVGEPFTVPTTANGDFVSPEMIATPGTESDGCVRIYCKVPGYDWWKSEFIINLNGADDNKISYRGKGGDQDRVGSKAGQRVYLNFSTDTGKME